MNESLSAQSFRLSLPEGVCDNEALSGGIAPWRWGIIVALVYDVCRPRDDVMTDAISESEFAANLSFVVRGTAHPDYQQAGRFFANTYPTEGLKELLHNVCARLQAKSSVSAIFRLDTSFGGGKTHGLIALYHAAKGMVAVANPSEFVEPTLIPTGPVRIAAYDGENADVANGRPMGDGVRAFTPWGEIAYQLAGVAGYELVRKSDEQRIAPGADTMRELFGDDPVLIVLDELGEYLRRVRNTDGRGQLTAFLKSLFSAVEGMPRAALVYTLAIRSDGTSADAFSEENEFIARAMAELESVSGRKATNLNPTKDDETAAVLRRRLFASVDEVGANAIVDAYVSTWARHEAVLPDEARRPATADEFRRSYPFHPDLLDTLTGKTATLTNFHRVRGMLRVLAKAVACVWKDRPADAAAIHLHHIDLGQDSVRREFTTRLQQTAYDPAIKNDIASVGGPGAKLALAAEVDATQYKGQAPYASYVARTIFLHTLAFNNDLRGVSAAHLRWSVLWPGDDPTFIDDARSRFQKESAYLDDKTGAPLRFNVEPNLTQIVANEERHVDAGAAKDELRIRIRDLFGDKGAGFELIPNPSGPFEVPDDVGEGKPRLVLISHDAQTVGASFTVVPDFVERMYSRKGSDSSGLRALRNNLVFVLADETKVSDMVRAMIRRIALRELKAADRQKDLAEHQRLKLLEQERQSETTVTTAIQQAYRHLLYPSKVGLGDGMVSLAHSVIDLPNASEQPGAGQRAVLRQLQNQQKVRDASDAPDSPAYIRDRTPLKRGQMSTGDLRAEFRKDPALPILLSDDAFRKAVRKGLEDGVYLYKRNDLVAGPGDPIPTVEIDEQSFVYTVDYAKLQGLWPRAETKPLGGGGLMDAGGEVLPPPPVPPEVGDNRSTGLPPGFGESDRTFLADGPLREALKDVFQKARSAKVEAVTVLQIRVFEHGDAFKLIPIASLVTGAAKHVTLEGMFQTLEESDMEFKFDGTMKDATSVKDFFSMQFNAAKEADLNATLRFTFDGGMQLDGDAPEQLIARLSQSSAAAHVEARAEAQLGGLA